jgi:hypothetical protein
MPNPLPQDVVGAATAGEAATSDIGTSIPVMAAATATNLPFTPNCMTMLLSAY